MTKKRNYYTTSKKAKIAIAAIESKLTQAQITSEYGVHATQIKTWEQITLKAIEEAFSWHVAHLHYDPRQKSIHCHSEHTGFLI